MKYQSRPKSNKKPCCLLHASYGHFSNVNCCLVKNKIRHRGGSRTAATSKMEDFVIIVNGFQPLTIITKNTILDVAAVLDPTLCHVASKVCCWKYTI